MPKRMMIRLKVPIKLRQPLQITLNHSAESWLASVSLGKFEVETVGECASDAVDGLMVNLANLVRAVMIVRTEHSEEERMILGEYFELQFDPESSEIGKTLREASRR